MRSSCASTATPPTCCTTSTWGSAWRGFLDRPLLGWGPENFSAVFDKYFDPRHFVPGEQSQTWFDRAHSVFFDYLATTGIVGLLSYLGMFAVFFWQFFKRARLRERSSAGALDTRRVVQNGLLFALPVAYLVQGAALFDVLPIFINLMLLFGFAVFLFPRTDDKKSS